MTTIKDVAKKSGFSVTTVSRALNGYNDVNENTRKKIISVANDLNYVPNKSAQRLVKKENNTIALLISEMEKEGGKDNMVYMLLSGMYAMAEKLDYEVALYTMNSAYQRKKSYVQFCQEHGIKGAIISGIRTDDKYFEELAHSDLPCVLIDIHLEGKNISSILIDDKKASKEIVTYLINNNHKNIAFVNGRREATVSIERLSGYKEALKEHNISLNENYIVIGDFLEDKAYEVTKKLLINNNEITALYCASDMMAIGAMKAIRELGKKIPEDISLVGFDDVPLAKYMAPPLTTIAHNFYDKGFEAANQLIKMMKNENYEKNINLKHELIIRNSVKNI